MVLKADAADERIRGRRVTGRELGDIEVRNEFSDIDDVDNALLGELVTFERADGDRYLVDILFTLGRGDRDFLEK